METLWQDVKYSFRSLRKAPGFALMAILVVTLGIGANTAIFSVVNAVLLQQLPYRDPRQLVAVWSRRTDSNHYPFSIADFEDLQSQSRSLSGLAAYAFWGANLTGQGEPERIQEVRATGNFFQVTGTNALLGRTLVPEDDNPGSPHVMVITYGLWQQRFGGDRSAVGQALNLNGESYTIVGILSPSFFFPVRAAELAVPLTPQSDPRRNDRADHFLNVIGRLAPGVSARQATGELDAIAQHLRQQYPATNSKNSGVNLVAVSDEIVGKFRTALLVLLGAVALLMLIACSSLANLLLARASARRREIAIRTALGASRPRLVRQLITETLILSGLGGIAGILLASWGVRLLIALSPAALPRIGEIRVDATVLGFAAGLSLFSGLIFGIVPGLQSVHSNFDHLRSSGALAEGAGKGNRARGFIVATQVALSLVLLIGAGLLLKSFSRLQAVDPGFEPAHVLCARIALPQASFPNNQSVVNFFDELRGRFQNLPGVTSAGAISILPLSGPIASVDFSIVGRPPALPSDVPTAQYRATGPGYMQAMGMSTLQGRGIAETDTEQSAKVALINQTMARQFFGLRNPIGEHLNIEETRDVEIVGVVSDIKQNSLDEEPAADIYVPYSQVPPFALTYLRNNMFWAVQTNGDPLALASAVRQAIRSVQKDVPISRLGPMEDYLAASAAPRRFNLLLIGIFGLTALLLAVLGVYGVISYSVTRRTREFGVRMALGAQRRDVLAAVMSQAGRLVGAGVVVGLAAAFACARLLTDLLFHVKPTDPATFAGVIGLVVAVAVLACVIPARRAAKVDPMVALRDE